MYKICSSCTEQKLFDQFSKRNSTKDGHTNQCKVCVKKYYEANRVRLVAQQREYQQTNKEKTDAYNQDYRRVNREKAKAYAKEYYYTNRDDIITRQQEYYEINKDKYFAKSAKRRAIKLQAKPDWLTVEELQQIAEFYKQAQILQFSTGDEYHVDHIVPLQGKTVCGLHVPWNLQVITAKENLSKSNKLLDDLLEI